MMHSRRLHRAFATLTLASAAAFLPVSTAFAAFCAAPGNDGPSASVAGIVNSYYAAGTATLAAGSTSITLGTLNPAGASTPVAAGDLLLVIQMQDATINSSNTVAYGDGTNGYGATTYGQSGLYEYVQATAVASSTVMIKGNGGGGGLVNTYNNAGFVTGTKGQTRYQVIRVPQYSSATISGTLAPARWNGITGGVVALDVAGTLTLSGSIDASGMGFRGGGGQGLGGPGGGEAATDYRGTAANNIFGNKGEGVAGTPRFYYDIPSATVIDNGVDGYPNGSRGRGAPGNAGGGGNDSDVNGNSENAGGGGGSNGGRGGLGGNTWNTNLPYGGLGGGVAPNAAGRLIMGGGGGSGARNNSNDPASSGGAGGGVIMVRAGTFAGSGVLRTDGTQGIFASNDGGGGSGAGGSVLAYTGSTFGSVTASAVGATGGSNDGAGATHGPGGGGGGGYVISNTALTSTVSGGVPGYTVTPGNLYGAGPGSTGQTSGSLASGSIVGASPPNICVPVITTTKAATPATVANSTTGANVSYTLTIANAAGRGSATSVVLSDTLPTGFTYASGATVTYAGGATGSAPPVNTGSATVPVLGTFTIPGGASLTLTVPVAIASTVANGVYGNVGQTQYSDPTRTAANGIATSNSPVANVTVTAAPIISGTVYSDANHNGSLDVGEGIVGPIYVKLAPYTAGACTAPAIGAYPTDATTGAYVTGPTAAGTYCLIVSLNNTLSDVTVANAGSFGYVPVEGAPGFKVVTVQSSPLPAQNFGFYNGSTVTGRVFNDNGLGGGTANNGVIDGGEQGINAVQLTVTNAAVTTTYDTEFTDGAGGYRAWIPVNATGALLVNEKLPSSYQVTNGSAGTTGGTFNTVGPNVRFTATAGTVYTGVNFGNVPLAQLSTDNSNQAAPGTTLYYPHVFMATTTGTVAISTTAVSNPVQGAGSSFVETLLLDANCNGQPDAGDGALAGSIAVAQGQKICFVVKEFVPKTVAAGTQNLITVSAQMTLSPTGTQYTLKRNDATVVSSGNTVVLTKQVRNVTTVTAFSTSNTASPNDIIEYQVSIFNPSTGPVTAVAISDTTPAYTLFVSAACPGTLPTGITSCAATTPAVGSTGPVQFTFTGSLASGATLSPTFQVRVQP